MLPPSPTPPPVLYKYYPPERVDIFENWSLRFSNPKRFNDTFDSDVRLHDKRPRVKGLIDLKSFGIFCMTSDPRSPLMWGHYAAQHTGFVVGFKTFLTPFADNDGPQLVIYEPTPPELPFTTWPPPIDIFRVKPDAWKYEKEWRCVRPFHFSESRDLPFAEESIAEIIVGNRIRTAPLTELLYVAETLNNAGMDISITQCQPNRITWELETQQCSYTLCRQCKGRGHVRRD